MRHDRHGKQAESQGAGMPLPLWEAAAGSGGDPPAVRQTRAEPAETIADEVWELMEQVVWSGEPARRASQTCELLLNRRIRTRMYGGVGGRGRKASAYPIP